MHIAPVSLQVRVHAWKWTFHVGSIIVAVETVSTAREFLCRAVPRKKCCRRLRLAGVVQDDIRVHATRLAGLRPLPSRTPALCEGVNVLLARTEEIQKVHAHVFARLADAQQDEVLFNCLRCPTPLHNIAKACKSFDRMLCV